MESVSTGHSSSGDYGIIIPINAVTKSVRLVRRQNRMLGALQPLLLLSFLVLGTKGVSNISDNVCYSQEVIVTLVNTSYLASVTETVWEFCWKIPPQCPRDIKNLVPRVKTENISRVINIAACCPGYEEDGEQCVPTCDPLCSHGNCSAPFTCSCEKGYSGAHCEEKGCPGGRWGKGCILKCFCNNGGKCHAVDGTCYCPKGFTGPLCEDKCTDGTFGENCSKKCSCFSGYSCHHISGECVKCPNETFGYKCEQACECNKNGTALCSHIDGKCFCEANWFGAKCDINCPFGFSNQTCIQKLENQTCSCPSNLFICDSLLGCVCPLGQNCGIEQKQQERVKAGLLQLAQSNASVGVAAMVVFFLVIGIIMGIFVLIYYRRRLNRIKKELANRSGHVNSSLDNNELDTPSPSVRQLPMVENNQIINVRPSQDSAHNPLYIVNYSKPEKNVNIARDGLERSPSNLNRPGAGCGDDELYHEPKELRNDLRAIFGKGIPINDDNDDYEDYDHLDHNRTMNEVSPNYSKFSK